jgi:hypothetical protein
MKTRGFEQELANAYTGEWMPMTSLGLTGLLTTNLEPFSKPPQIRHMNEVQMFKFGVFEFTYTPSTNK